MYQIILSSNSKKSLVLYILFLKLLFKKLKLNFSVFNLPSTKKRLTLLKSPHVYKKSKEHFEIKNFKVLFSFNSFIEINTLKYLMLNKPHSVVLKLKF
ncbi:MAG: hypothetical protein JKY42_00565 [Flavobacteriales bacterium]|nr:hypothetical protein [Flavobacteriales bacterium]